MRMTPLQSVLLLQPLKALQIDMTLRPLAKTLEAPDPKYGKGTPTPQQHYGAACSARNFCLLPQWNGGNIAKYNSLEQFQIIYHICDIRLLWDTERGLSEPMGVPFVAESQSGRMSRGHGKLRVY